MDTGLGGSAADVERWKGAWILSQTSGKRRSLIGRAQAYWQRRGFPFQVTSPEEAVSQLQNLRRSILARSFDQLIERMDTAGLRLANSYHPQMWSVRAYGRRRSPIEYFKDNQVLGRMLERAPRF